MASLPTTVIPARRSGTHPRSEARSEDGQTLIEVVVAIALLVIVLVPAVLLTTQSTAVTYNNQFKVTAANLANSQLNVDRNVAVQQGLTSLPLSQSKQYVGNEQYAITPSAGWCTAPSSSGGPWGNAVTPINGSDAFVVLVNVSWKGNPSKIPNSVQAFGVLSSPPGSVPTLNTCPLVPS